MIPRQEHPNPQFERESWLNLNGEWQFELDNGRSGIDRKLYESDKPLAGTIIVPFCPQSRLSGIGNTEFLSGMWYQRTVTLSDAQCAGRTLLHFGAVDYRCVAYVNGKEVGRHRGGYVSFSFDVTNAVVVGENRITVYAEDDERDPMIPNGKQSRSYHSGGCDYTRTSGIWQTVWLEFMPEAYIDHVNFYPNPAQSALILLCNVHGVAELTIAASFDGKPVGSISVTTDADDLYSLTLPLTETHLWEVGRGNLYDLTLTFGDDVVHSYFGLRNIRMKDMKFLLNGKSVFQRLVLDQGFYPDGIYTAPDEEALIRDIELSQAMGFNGARLHQKVFEPRFLYHCDRLGYLVWGEYPSWGLDDTCPESIFSVQPEWIAEIKRDFNHPAIVGWCPFNETWDIDCRKQDDDVLRLVYELTKMADRTRPCIDTSGNFHVETDIFDLHDYEQDVSVFRPRYDAFVTDDRPFDRLDHRQVYRGEPVFVSEYGGIKWVKDAKTAPGWGYGNAPKTEEEFIERFQGLTDTLLDNPKMFGLCYTQLTDIEQEQNGLYTYQREPKFPPEIISAILSRKAAIES